MGNKDSRIEFEHGNLYIALDKQSYSNIGPDKVYQVSGNLYLHLTQPFPGGNLSINFKGYEKTKWREEKSYTDHKGRRQTYYEHYKGGNDIIDQTYQIYQFQDECALPGQYVFPFKLPLPGHLPSSIEYSHASAEGTIKYNLKGILEASNKEEVKNMEHEVDVTLKQAITEDVKYDIVSEKESNVKQFFGFFGKGKAKVSAKFDKSVYEQDDVMKIEAEIDNSSWGVPVKAVKVKLEQHVNMTSKGKQTYHRVNKIYSNKNPVTVNKGVTNTLDFQIDLKHIDTTNLYKEEKKVDKFKPMPERIVPSISGIAVRISYLVSIQLEYGFMKSSDTKVTHLCSILPSKLSEEAQHPELNQYAVETAPVNLMNSTYTAPVAKVDPVTQDA